MLTNGSTDFTPEGFAAVIADLRRLYLLVGGGSNDLNQASADVTQDGTETGENANNAFKIRGIKVSTTAPLDGEVMTFSADRKQYEPVGAGANGALLAANNLTDLASIPTARTNLGLGTAAQYNVGSLLQAANNLSEVTVPATARTNIGLGLGNSPTFNELGLTANLSVGSGSQLSGGVKFALHTMTGNYTALASDTFIIASGNTVTMPTAAGAGSKTYIIASDPGSGGSTIMASGAGQTVGNVTGSVLGANLMTVLLSDNVSNWYRTF